MIEILEMEDFGPQTVHITPDLRRAFARILKQYCKSTGNCDTCADRVQGQLCPYKGNPVNWRV
ncbi:MAG: hypothetical protein HFH59_09345 [Lachnospiraceae bacterium]|jgi:hypothetical protein|nr:hypothetical protein [Lachnospiraceae bacterium]MCI9357728.1 hypothetical protein [Lachnospiraceae bacterium]